MSKNCTIGLICLLVSILSMECLHSQNEIWIEDFEQSDRLMLSDEWRSRHKGADTLYTIKANDENAYLDAHTFQSDNFVIKKVDVDIVEYPYLNWRWKAITLPKDGDESLKKYCDVVACINVVLRARRWAPKTIKYSWSTTLKKGTLTKSPFAFWPARADIVVVESGDSLAGTWIHEKVNVLEAYKRLYKKKKVKSYNVQAIAIMSDSDNTSSESHAAYDDIFFSKE